MLAGLVVFAALCGAAVLYGVLTHDEPGLLEDAPGWVRLIPDDFPLTVEAYEYWPSGPTRVYEEGPVAEAMSRLNARAGFDLFVWAPRGEDGDVEVMLDAPLDIGDHVPPGDFGVTDPGANSRWMRVPPARLSRTCLVRTSNIAGTGDLPVLVVEHELGHCLLLAHDCYRQSIMCGGDCCILAPTPDRAIPPWLSDSDGDLVRELYGPR